MNLQYIDVSGVGNAGKGAVVDFLKEFQGFHIPAHSFELDLFRLPGGILDLEFHTVQDWSPIRSDRAIKDFLILTRRMGSNPHPWDVYGRLFASGQRLDKIFNGKFTELAEKFVLSLVYNSFKAYWPYDLYQSGILKSGIAKLFLKLGFSRLVQGKVYLVKADHFGEKVTQFYEALFQEVVDPNTTHVVLNNSFEPFQPLRSLNLLKNSKSILVYRDPRDVFVTGLNSHKVKSVDKKIQAKENNGINKSFLASDDIEKFVDRYNLYMSHLFKSSDPRVLTIRFEDFVFNHDLNREKIYQFLEVDRSQHKQPGTFFVEQKSKSNIGIWQNYSNQKEIEYITIKLRDYLWSPS